MQARLHVLPVTTSRRSEVSERSPRHLQSHLRPTSFLEIRRLTESAGEFRLGYDIRRLAGRDPALPPALLTSSSYITIPGVLYLYQPCLLYLRPFARSYLSLLTPTLRPVNQHRRHCNLDSSTGLPHNTAAMAAMSSKRLQKELVKVSTSDIQPPNTHV